MPIDKVTSPPAPEPYLATAQELIGGPLKPAESPRPVRLPDFPSVAVSARPVYVVCTLCDN
jgi:hypothetical protein